jgi:succinate dehydrogenase / fumarate reductase flavoprotein subunit
MGLGIDGKNQVYLDITNLPKDVMEQKLSNVIDLYEKFSGDDPRKVPMKVYPAPHYAMGGIYVDAKHRTQAKGLYACGECDFMYHGGNRLGGNSLLSATYSGYIAAKTIIGDYEGGSLLQISCSKDDLWIKKILSDRENEMVSYLERNGNENVETISKELGKILIENAGIVRYNANLENALHKIQELKERWQNIACPDKGIWANSSIIAIRKLRPCIVLAEAIVTGALARNESRGAHYKPDFPNRDDSNWLKTTVARYENAADKITLQYKPVDVSILRPQDEKD